MHYAAEHEQVLIDVINKIIGNPGTRIFAKPDERRTSVHRW